MTEFDWLSVLVVLAAVYGIARLIITAYFNAKANFVKDMINGTGDSKDCDEAGQ